VAKLAGVSPSGVQRVEAEPAVRSLDSVGERTRRGVGRTSKLEAFRGLLVAELARQPDVMAVELLHRARLAGYAGSKSVLYEIIEAIRPREQAAPLARAMTFGKSWVRESRTPGCVSGKPNGLPTRPQAWPTRHTMLKAWRVPAWSVPAAHSTE
jgi:hypothetical protein